MRNLRLSSLARRIDTILQGGLVRQITALLVCNVLFLALFVLISWGLGYVLSNGSAGGEDGGSRLWNIYNAYIDTGNQVGVAPGERWLALLTSLCGSVLVGGLLISTLSNIIERRVERCRSGLVRYKLSGHYVIIGADSMLADLVRQLFAKDPAAQIAIQTIQDVAQVRRKLYSRLPRAWERRIVFCYARRDAREELEAIGVAEAREVYILGDSGELDDVEYYHDSLNVDCLNLIGLICKEAARRPPLRCYLLMEYRSTFSVFQFSDIAPELKSYIDLCPFNFYETWARKVLVLNKAGRLLAQESGGAYAPIHYRPLDYRPITYDSERFVHLVIVGMSKMGEALAIEAAHIAHFPNFVRDCSRRTRITFVDSDARACSEQFRQAYPALFNLCYWNFVDAETGAVNHHTPQAEYAYLGRDFIDIEWQFVEGRIESDAVRKLLDQWADEPNALMTVAVCLNLTHQSIATALYLPESIRAKDIPVLVQQRITSAIIDNLSGELEADSNAFRRFAHLRPFGMLGDCFTPGGKLEECAKRVNLAYNHGRDIEAYLSRADVAQLCEREWAELKKEQVVKQWSNLYHASSLPTKLRSLGYQPEDLRSLHTLPEDQVELLAEVEHNRWNVEELLLGYRPLNAAEEAEYRKGKLDKRYKKHVEFVHCDIRSYSELKEESKYYDRLTSRYLPYLVTGTDATNS